MSLLCAHGAMIPLGGAGGYTAAVLADAPWGYWRLEDAPAANASAADTSGHNRSGTYRSGASNDFSAAAGVFSGTGASVNFRGAGYVVCPQATLGSGQAFTLECMLRTSTIVENQSLVGGDDGSSDRRWQMRTTSGGNLQFLTIYPSVNAVTSAAVVADGNPHLLHVVFDPSLAASAGICKLYVDGVLDTASTAALSIDPGTVTPVIAARTPGGNNPYTGLLDEVAIYMTALGAEQIAAHWAARNLA
ncbi:hypothetical protein NB688_000595 [Xanthomonas sacchari]|uniref:LamG-like jellyroll fold domain-containing protein n=1 Tax=Xanthomonas sacchari TaxID=56458 RepID=A0ABT3DTT6_9XANT|nr:LamG domain-containing protein [Xanthomonas sacchari]MCW0398781.1 hypothetical protein [Xanthomonas sacchari]MCW0418429.1 hypothetical protein [Xanthomonas sacchari]UYK72508.1 LamG domain-containing protein [Xanthomonas sacchari]